MNQDTPKPETIQQAIEAVLPMVQRWDFKEEFIDEADWMQFCGLQCTGPLIDMIQEKFIPDADCNLYKDFVVHTKITDPRTMVIYILRWVYKTNTGTGKFKDK